MRSSRRIHRARIFGLVSILLAGSVLIINPVNAETAARPFSVAEQDPPTDSDEPPIVSDKVDADLAVALDTKGSADFYIDFADHADLAAASSITDWADRGAAVVKALQATADASQAEVRKQLDAEQVSYTSFWIANTILVRSGSTELARAGGRAGRRGGHSGPSDLRDPRTDNRYRRAADQRRRVGHRPDPARTTSGRPSASAARASWSAASTPGSTSSIRRLPRSTGATAAARSTTTTTGSTRRRCAPAGSPCDNNNHGTHTMGTMVGGDGGANNIGVAPGATVDRRQRLRVQHLLGHRAAGLRPMDAGAHPAGRVRRRPRTATAHHQQLLGRTGRQQLVQPDHRRLARRRHLPGVLRRQQRPGLRIGRFARRRRAGVRVRVRSTSTTPSPRSPGEAGSAAWSSRTWRRRA